MRYYDMDSKEMEKRGIDYDLGACLEYNGQGAFQLSDIEKVLAVVEGERDGADWHWILKLKAPVNKMRYVYLVGGCDYTGWDCQSWATHKFAKTPLQAAKLMITKNVPITRNQPFQAGLGHMLNLLSGEYTSGDQEKYESIVNQLKDKKSKTWREENDKGVPVVDLPTTK